MHHLTLDLSEDTDGLLTIEAMGSTSFEQHAAVLAEAQRLLQWAQRNYAHTQGPVEDGMDWDHDLQVHVEDGRWHTVTLTISASPRFAEAFFLEFGDPRDDT
jgi:hypothetical protein